MNINQSQSMSAGHCLDNALAELQLIFPTLALSRAQRAPCGLAETLARVCQALPVPDAASRECTLATMRLIIDQQEYKYQRSLLAADSDPLSPSLSLFEDECFYEQQSTGLCKKDTAFTACDPKSDMVDDVWGWKEEKADPQEEYLLFID